MVYICVSLLHLAVELRDLSQAENDNRIILSEKSCHFVDLLSQMKQTSTDVDYLAFFSKFCEQEICKLRKDCANSILKAETKSNGAKIDGLLPPNFL